jgi:hypothetical protein
LRRDFGAARVAGGHVYDPVSTEDDFDIVYKLLIEKKE